MKVHEKSNRTGIAEADQTSKASGPRFDSNILQVRTPRRGRAHCEVLYKKSSVKRETSVGARNVYVLVNNKIIIFTQK